MTKATGGVAWFSSAKAAEYLGYPSRRAFEAWLHREHAAGRDPIKVYMLGSRMRFRRVDLDAAPEPMPAADTASPLRLVGGRA